jgi:two-component system sensor histidine kinase EvgS
MFHEGGEVALAWRPTAGLDLAEPRELDAERKLGAVELVRKARQAWLDVQELDRLPDSVWGVLKLMPALWTALERAETSGESSRSVARILAQEVTRHIDPVETALRRLTAAPTPDWPQESKAAVAELQSLVDRLLCVADDLGHLEAPTSLREVVDEVFAVHRQRAEQAGVALVGAYDLPPLPVDVERLRLVLSLLVEDAVRRSDPERAARHVAVRAWPGENGAGQGWRIEVADNGRPRRDARRRAATVAEESLGAAGSPELGLDICRLAVEQMGGELWIVTDPAEGTRVRFTVPDLGNERARDRR